MDSNPMGVSPEELQEEENLLKPSKEEELRAEIVRKYGLDEVDNAELIGQLLNDKLEDQKRFGKVVAQKRKWREEAAKKPQTPTASTMTPATLSAEEVIKKAREEARAELESRDLEELRFPDELSEAVKTLAKLKGVSVRKAAEDPYITFQKAEYDRKQKAAEAAISRTNQSAATTQFSADAPPTVDMSTEEGRNTWLKYKAFLRSQQK